MILLPGFPTLVMVLFMIVRIFLSRMIIDRWTWQRMGME
jgi:hypothetical protein